MTLVDRLLELHIYRGYLEEREQKEFESIKKQLEEMEIEHNAILRRNEELQNPIQIRVPKCTLWRTPTDIENEKIVERLRKMSKQKPNCEAKEWEILIANGILGEK